TASATWSSDRWSASTTARRAPPTGTSSAAGSTTATTPPCGRSCPLPHVQPLGKPARRVPRLPPREPAPPGLGGHAVVVAHPPDPEREATALVARELAGLPRAAALRQQDHVRVGRHPVPGQV